MSYPGIAIRGLGDGSCVFGVAAVEFFEGLGVVGGEWGAGVVVGFRFGVCGRVMS